VTTSEEPKGQKQPVCGMVAQGHGIGGSGRMGSTHRPATRGCPPIRSGPIRKLEASCSVLQANLQLPFRDHLEPLPTGPAAIKYPKPPAACARGQSNLPRNLYRVYLIKVRRTSPIPANSLAAGRPGGTILFSPDGWRRLVRLGRDLFEQGGKTFATWSEMMVAAASSLAEIQQSLEYLTYEAIKAKAGQ